VSDVSQAKVLIVVFAMPQCPACHEYLPRFWKQVEGFQRLGYPFVPYAPSTNINRGDIPILVYDVTSKDPSVQQFADRFEVSSVPATVFLPKMGGFHKLVGAQDDETIYRLLLAATTVNSN